MSAPAGLYKFVVDWKASSGIARDAVQYDFHFASPGSIGETELTHMSDDLWKFFDTVGSPIAGAVDSFFSNELSSDASAVDIRTYLVPLVRGPLGPPHTTRSYSPSSIGSHALPEEVALVMSFEADVSTISERGPGGTRPRSSRRNRVYLGPLDTTANTQDPTTKRSHPTDGIRNLVLQNAALFLDSTALRDGWVWQTFSPKLWQMFPVLLCWVDDAWDTQRRRGPASVTRSSVGIA